MPAQTTPPYGFGDLLALARQSWVRQMTELLLERGHGDYRITDAAALRLLSNGPLSIGELAEALGISRQAARKAARGLEQRGYAETNADLTDARRLNVALTTAGSGYAEDVIAVIERLNRRIARVIKPVDLAGADAALRAVIGEADLRQRSRRIPPPSHRRLG